MKKRLKKKKTKQICMLIYLFQKNDTNFNVIIHAFPRADNNCDTPLCGYRWFFKSRNIIKNIKYENYESISFTNYEIKNGFEIYFSSSPFNSSSCPQSTQQQITS